MLLFPAGDGVGVGRAVLVTVQEAEGAAVGVWVGEQERRVARGALTLTPSGNAGRWVEGLNREIRRWGEDTDWAEVRYDADAEDPAVRTLEVRQKDGSRQRFVYRVAGEAVTPMAAEVVDHWKSLAK